MGKCAMRHFFQSVWELRCRGQVLVPSPFENVSDSDGEDQVVGGEILSAGSSSFDVPPVATAPMKIEDEDLPVISSSVRTVLVGLIALVSKAVMQGLNNTTVIDGHKLEEAVYHRPERRGLITVSNHTSAVDDPFTPAALVPTSWILDSELVRWTLCATDRCFKNPIMAYFFRMVKVLPIQRGAGLDHPFMEAAVNIVERGHWMHMFPEGTRSKTGTLSKMKIGIGKLVAAATNTPLVLPFVHDGMQGILTKGRYFPATGQQVIIAVGDPIDFTEDLKMMRAQGLSEKEIYVAIASKVGYALEELQAKIEKYKNQ